MIIMTMTSFPKSCHYNPDHSHDILGSCRHGNLDELVRVQASCDITHTPFSRSLSATTTGRIHTKGSDHKHSHSRLIFHRGELNCGRLAHRRSDSNHCRKRQLQTSGKILRAHGGVSESSNQTLVEAG